MIEPSDPEWGRVARPTTPGAGAQRSRWILRVGALLAGLLAPAVTQGQNLQIHFMDVWQGDGALLVSPKGETVLFDDGVNGHCDLPLAYLQQLGVSSIDYHVASHYHADHIGCAAEVLSEFPLRQVAYDRGGEYKTRTKSFLAYLAAVGATRRTAEIGTEVVLDQGSATPVTIRFVALNATTASGLVASTDNENDLSVAAVIEYGGFRAEIGGDLSGADTNNYADIETGVAPHVGRIDVYKVHHHCSEHSTNAAWLATTTPRIGIVSCGDGNSYGHPTAGCLQRLHAVGVKTYWTERGAGAAPVAGKDVVGGTIVVEADATKHEYTVTRMRDQVVDRYAFWGVPAPGPGPGPAPAGGFAWSKLSAWYHYANCAYVKSISAQNLVRGTTAPTGKSLHSGCPR